MKLKYFKNQKGLTLIETIIYMGLLSILLVVLTEMLVSILDLRLESQAVSSVDQDGRFIVERLFYDVGRADSITSPANPGDVEDTLVLNIGGETYSYSVSGDDLLIENNSGSANLNSSETKISDLQFSKFGLADRKNSVQVEFTVSSVAELNKGSEIRDIKVITGVKK